MHMVIVRFIREHKEMEVKEGSLLIRVMRNAGISMETPCGGAGFCGKCKVRALQPEALQLAEPLYKFTEAEIAQGMVLACQARVYKDVEIDTRRAETEEHASILSEGDTRTAKVSMKVLRERDPADFPRGMYGLTVDIGTTTLVCALIDLLTGEELAAKTALNPQCVYAQDVVSRIRYTTDEAEGLNVLFTAVSQEINRLLGLLAEERNISTGDILAAVYAGNTTMLHLALHTDPSSLGKYPYTPVITGGLEVPAREAGIEIHPDAAIYIPPVISSYVGADITAGMVAERLDQEKKTTLFIDIGTNGEMLLASQGELTATSTAAGPAFEGMNITFGMRASDGAIEYFDLDEDMRESIRTIKDAPVKGICGSGLFDLVGELVRTGVIEKSGRFVKAEKWTKDDRIPERLVKYKGKAAYRLPREVYLTQMDIRQIQLAKSAIRAGIEAML